MELNKILQADLIDIVFEGRNKEYGAYQLRKTYNRRMVLSLFVTSVLVTFLFVGYLMAGRPMKNEQPQEVDRVVELTKVEPAPEEVKVLPPAAKPAPLKVEMKQYTPPNIVDDAQVDESDKPPLVNELEDTKIALVSSDGAKDDGIVAPPLNDNKKGIIDAPKRDAVDEDAPFIKVEIESTFPGGAGAWMRYLNKTFRYPQEAQDNGVQGTVVVQFIVDREGNVSDVEAISGPASSGLREEAVRVIKKSGKWDPAIQNGKKVKSYKRQPITFKLEME